MSDYIMGDEAIFPAEPSKAMMSVAEEQGAGRQVINLQQDEQRNRYEILRVVNRGGMGEIALGRVRGAKGFEKLVVLKRLRADAERDDHIAMFDVEQELMSRIEHPNIVKVFDQPIIDSTPYLAMEYVRGRNLDQIIRQAKDANETLSTQFSLTVISEVLRGLAFVHRLKDNEGKALGVVHQDITPSNIMVSFFGETKITDFGISYVTSRDGGLRRGVLKGKPRYVAPEVLAGKRVNNRADIYGVGLVLYEMVAQNALFARATVKETLAAVARGEQPDFHAEIPNLDEGLLKIFQKSLAKDPADRYRTAEEMGADVIAELAKLGGAVSPARLGYIVRQHFRDDPDVPEIDPSFEAALAAEAQPVLPATFRPPDLSQTISELDRLLGPRNSTDLFTLPADLKSELAGIEDMDPFLALTPIPDFVWDAPNDQELLRRAGEAFGPAPLVREAPPLNSEDAGPLLPVAPPMNAAVPPPLTAFPTTAPKPISSPRNDSIPSFDALRPKNGGRIDFDPMPQGTPLPRFSSPAISSSTSASPEPLPRATSSPRNLALPPASSSTSSSPSPHPPTPPLRAPSAPEMQAPVVPAASLKAQSTPGIRVPDGLRPSRSPVETPLASVENVQPPRSISPPRGASPLPRAPSGPGLRNPSSPGMARAERVEPLPRAESKSARENDPSAALQIREVGASTADTEPDRRNFQFWLGLGLGLALGIMLGATMFAMFSAP